jgi:hypothetical protein
MVTGKSLMTAGLGALALGAAVLISAAPAEAGSSTGTWRNGMVAGPYGAGYYGPARRPYYRHHHGNAGGAVAAGVIGGLALGALAASPAYSYPAYSYPAYGYPAYPYRASGVTVYGAPACYVVRRRFVDGWGRVIVRRERVCE